mmetsp:Transcript_42798/g.46474  ORF Transcript_42798/g.46474 Transcript_42798/m.46474 type:complete len:103 (-) Transcript_42798:1975-2283(-)
MAEFDGMDWPLVWGYTLYDVIFDSTEYKREDPGTIGVNTPGPWLPRWQTQLMLLYSPPYNWDLHSLQYTSTMNTTALENVGHTRKVAITEVYFLIPRGQGRG